jgi:hypothetical protein
MIDEEVTSSEVLLEVTLSIAFVYAAKSFVQRWYGVSPGHFNGCRGRSDFDDHST